MDIGLSGYATYIQAGASHLTLFYYDHLQALLGGIFSGAVAPRPRTDDADIEHISGRTADDSVIVHFSIVDK
jgi:hypothetical protein